MNLNFFAKKAKEFGEMGDEITTAIMWSSLFVSGLIFIAIYLFIARLKGYNFVELILPTEVELVQKISFISTITQESVCVFGVLVGVVYIITSFYILSFKKQGRFRIAIKAVGFLIGYIITYFVIKLLFSNSYEYEYSWSLFLVKLIYLYLCFFLFERIKDFFDKLSPIKSYKYYILVDGMFAFASVPFLTRGYDSELSTILSGPIFLLCFFLGLWISEKFYAPLILGSFRLQYDSMYGRELFESDSRILEIQERGMMKGDFKYATKFIFKVMVGYFKSYKIDKLSECEEVLSKEVGAMPSFGLKSLFKALKNGTQFFYWSLMSVSIFLIFAIIGFHVAMLFHIKIV